MQNLQKINEAERAKRYLCKDFLQNCNMISALDSNISARFLYNADDGVCFFDTENEILYLSTENTFAAKAAVSRLDFAPELCVAQHIWDKEVLSNEFGLDAMPCYQVLYNTKVRQPVSNDISVEQLGKSYAELVSEKYTMHESVAQVEKIMDKFGIYGAFENGELAGFIGRHEEGSIGMLEVFPKFRRHGIGSSLINFMVNLCAEKNQIAYAHIIFSNEKSLALHKKLDCELTENFVFWCFKA